ncbi:FAD-binding oxidoreductase [Mesorhizobium plurifarium]|uniref:FAD-binding oxidoreductase n=1 Tax=Sinorhizobium arboris TaxID=76745 RepID=UPI0004819BD7|nr:FAD-binding oxidoreductase [Sinorhizobium arboris]PST24589.1 FAD-binding oxidoreductase [Mesorhizobium plurifarium]
MRMDDFENAGRFGNPPRPAVSPDDYEDGTGSAPPMAFLPVGNRLSDGDVCRNELGMLIESGKHNRIQSFDPGSGIIRCEAGVVLADLLARAVPHRFFLPVTPATGAVTVGGAVANDVHGGNHHARGSFGNHVRRLTLLRSTGERLVCSPKENAELFAATIGGLGLTGLILDVELGLMKVPSPHVQRHVLRFDSLDRYFALAQQAGEEHEYSVAWLDQLATGRRTGRGVLFAADHADGACEYPDIPKGPKLAVPFSPPFGLFNSLTLKMLNEYRFRKHGRGEAVSTEKWTSYFHPLDAVSGWRRLYGRRGPCQHQSVYPVASAPETTARLLEAARRAGHASVRTKLQRFGDMAPRGLLSFARPGFTLTLDFASQGRATVKLLDALDEIVVAAGGAVNPCHDFRMSPAVFEASFPSWKRLEALRDPAMVSDFWRRTALALR